MRKIFVLALGISLTGAFVKAQTLDSKYGLDSAKTIEQVSIFTEFVKQKNYKDALPAWRYVFQTAPRFQLNTYVRGESIIMDAIIRTKNPAYVDTLMMIYDQWIKYFGTHQRFGEGYVLGKKGFNLYRMRGINDANAAKEAFGYLTKSYEMEGAKTHPLTAKMTYAVADELLKKQMITKDEYMALYLKLSDYAEKGLKNAKSEKEKADYTDVKNTVNSLFYNAGVADCPTLIGFLQPKFEANPDDLPTLKEIASVLRRGECTDQALFAQVAEKIYQQDPSADAAYNLAMLFLKRQEFDKTESYLAEAIGKSDADDPSKADYYFRMAQIKLSKKQFANAKKNALEALKLNPDMGSAYMLIGNAYAAYSKSYGEDDFDHASVFWAAVDKFVKAKQVDPSLTEEVDQLIKAYSPHFPSKDEAFFRSVVPGSPVQIGDWIGETTKARFR